MMDGAEMHERNVREYCALLRARIAELEAELKDAKGVLRVMLEQQQDDGATIDNLESELERVKAEGESWRRTLERVTEERDKDRAAITRQNEDDAWRPD